MSPLYKRIAKSQALRKRVALRLEVLLPSWLHAASAWVACKIIGHEPTLDPQYDSRQVWCAWCRPS